MDQVCGPACPVDVQGELWWGEPQRAGHQDGPELRGQCAWGTGRPQGSEPADIVTSRWVRESIAGRSHQPGEAPGRGSLVEVQNVPESLVLGIE